MPYRGSVKNDGLLPGKCPRRAGRTTWESVATLVLAGVILAGCGGDDSGSATTEATTAETTSTTAAVTTEQVASAVVSARQSELDALANVETCVFPYSCDPTSLFLVMSTLDISTDTLLLVLSDLPTLVGGEIPAEMTDLVERTADAAEQLKDSTGEYTATCAGGGPTCEQLETDISFYVGNVQRQLEAWEPYI